MGNSNFTVTFEENRGSILENIIKDTLNEYFRQHPTESITDEQLGAILGEYLTNHPIEGLTISDVNTAIADYLVSHPIEGVSTEEVNSAIASYLQAHPIVGEKGDTGADGKSAYEIAVENGFSGTEQEWLASLQGESGASAEDIASAVDEYLQNNSVSEIDLENKITSVDGIEKDLAFESVTMTTQDGVFLTYSGDTTSFSTGKIGELAVEEGERYMLSCSASSSAICYMVYDENDTIILKYPDISSNQTERTYIYRKIVTMPQGARTLKVSTVKTDWGFDVKKVHDVNKVDTKGQNIDEILNSFSSIDGVRSTSESMFLKVTPDRETNGFYFDKGGSNIVQLSSGNGKIAEMDVAEGEVYKIHGSSQWLTTLYAVFDTNGNVLEKYPTTSQNESNRRDETLIVTMPQGARYLRVCAYPQTADVEIWKKVSDTSFSVPSPENVSYGNVLFNKKWCACGDSFTEGDFSGGIDENGLSGTNSPHFYDSESGRWKTYPYWIAQRNKMTVQWLAQSGTDFTNCANADRPFSRETTGINYTMIDSDCDYVTLAYGLNELDLTAEQIGAKGDTTNSTLWGAYHVVITSILTANPFCKIGIIINDGSMTQSYHDTLIEIAKYYGVPYLDLKDGNVTSQLRGKLSEMDATVKALRTNSFRVSANNHHPNVEAHQFRSTIIENFLRTL